MEVAVKGIWLLYRRGRWNLLEKIGLSRHDFERLFQAFDFLYLDDIAPDAPLRIGRMNTQYQVNRFLQICPEVKHAGDLLLTAYRNGVTL